MEKAFRFLGRVATDGDEVAIDATDLPAYANGQRFHYNHGPERQRYSDPDASWGRRSALSTRKGGGFYGCRSRWPRALAPASRSRGERDGKHEYGRRVVVRVRGLERVRLHADLVMLAGLAQALDRAHAT